jgi:hypothetical protein
VPAVACPFCGSDHPEGTFVCPNTNRRLQGLLPTGTSIEGKYRIEGIIGVGGMGVVYRAEQTKINRLVALKMLLPEYIVYPDLVARVEREARTAGQIEHPNVVSIVDLGSTTEFGPLHRDGAPARTGAGHGGRERRREARPAGGRGRHAAGARGPRGRPQEGRHPPRPQAREHLPEHRRRRQAS